MAVSLGGIVRFWLIAAGVVAVALPAVAGAASGGKDTAGSSGTKSDAKESVTVSASKPSVQVLPDRTVYSLKDTIQSTTSSLSDILRDLPSVNVDIDGNVTLRGDSNVTILIDGKPSPLLAGNRGDALQQIPASLIDHIEIITNPSAEFRAEGSAGIINIVLKKKEEPGARGVVRINVGDRGHANASASGNIKLHGVTLFGAYGERRDGRSYTFSSTRSDGSATTLSEEGGGRWIYAGRYAVLNGRFNATAADEVQIGGSYNGWTGHSNGTNHNVSSGAATDVTRESLSVWTNEGAQAHISYSHAFATKDESLDLDASRFSFWSLNKSDDDDIVTATGLADYWQSRRAATRNTNTELKAGYKLPLPRDGQFKAGYALNDDNLLTDNRGIYRDPTMADWANDSFFTNNFLLDRTVHAGYVSYQQKFGRFGVMAGLRLEQDFLHTDLKTTGEIHDTQTLGFYPSVHLSYALTDTQQFRLSYSRRVNRPGASQLNPTRYSSDAYNVQAGNPYLASEQVDSFETSYHYIGEKFDAAATGYYRATYKAITQSYRYLSPTTVLTTPDNLARRSASGFEVNLNATLLEGLTARSSGTLAYNEFNPGIRGIGKKESGINWNVRGGFDWQATPIDILQFNANYNAKAHNAYGYTEPVVSGNLGFKHKFDGGVSAVLSVNNLFDSATQKTVLDVPGLHSVSRSDTPGRIFYIGLVYTFGGYKDTERAGEGDSEAGPQGVPH